VVAVADVVVQADLAAEHLRLLVVHLQRVAERLRLQLEPLLPVDPAAVVVRAVAVVVVVDWQRTPVK
jgi:hypothetical protein